MVLTDQQRTDRLRKRITELELWTVRARAPLDQWTFNEATLPPGAPWPTREGVAVFAHGEAEVPADWPLEHARLDIDLGGEGLVRIAYASGDSAAFGLDPNHQRFPLKERRFGVRAECVARLPFGEPVRVPNPVLFLIVMALGTGLAFRWTRWGRHVFAIGGNEHAAMLTGVPVRRIKVAVYMISSLSAAIAAIIQTGWLGAVTTNIGAGMELQVIAAAVIGGANLAGGVGTAFGALVGAALIEVIRNSLGLLGINAFWQGTFIGGAIVLAVMFDRIRNFRQSD